MTKPKTPTIRTKVFKLSLTDAIDKRLQAMSDKYGLPYSTMAAFAIGEWLNTKEVQLGFNQGILTGFKESFKEILESEIANNPEALKKAEEQLLLIRDDS